MTYRIRSISFTAESGAFPFHAVLSKLNRDHPEQLVTLKDIKFLRHVATYLVVRSTRVVVLREHKTKKMKNQNLSNFGKNRKNSDSITNFEFDTICWYIFYKILINFEVKIESNFHLIISYFVICWLCWNFKKLMIVHWLCWICDLS